MTAEMTARRYAAKAEIFLDGNTGEGVWNFDKIQRSGPEFASNEVFYFFEVQK